MKIVLVGGGSGGHLTPLLAVASAIKKKNSAVEIIYIGQKNENLMDILEGDNIDAFHAISAGKFRRYHGESVLSHLLDIKTILLNIRDLFRLIIGFLESWRLLSKIKPDSIFLKGGFVCVPVGLAARFKKIKYITHDSDVIPGLANRITAKHALLNTTALPVEMYPYEVDKSRQVGIPLRAEFKKVQRDDQINAKLALRIDPKSKVLLSVGGGLGAQKINHALVKASNKLLTDNKTLHIIHLTGKKHYDETMDLYKSTLDSKQLDRVKIVDFTTEMNLYSASADLVLTRAGATNIAELATQAKACIVVPNPVLTGGQQLHNAKVLEEANAAEVLSESNIDTLSTVVQDLLNNEKRRSNLENSLNKLSVEESAEKIADILIDLA